MSLIDDRKSGYTAQAINAAPIYPGAAWAHKFVIETNDLTGFIFEIYARETVRSSTRCFNIDFTVADEDGKKVLYPLAVNTTTKKAFLNKTVFVTCQFTETATGNTYIAFEGVVAVGAGSLSGIVEVPTIPGIVTVSDGDYGDILVTGAGLNWAVKESAVTQHRAALNIPEPIAIANDLVTNEAAQALSAAQGVVLKGYIDALNTLVASDDISLDTLQEIVDFIVINKATLDTLGISNIAGLQSALDLKATAAQGALADSALQSGANISSLTNDSGFIVDYVVTEADVVIHQSAITVFKAQISDFNDSQYATSAQGLLADSAAQPGANISIFNNNSGFLTDYSVTETDVTQHQGSLSISGNQVSIDSQSNKVLDGLNSQSLWDQTDKLILDARSTGIKSGGKLIDLGGGIVRIEAGSGAILDNTDTSNQSYASIDWIETDIDLSAADGLFWICVDFNEQITFTSTQPSINDFITVIWLWRVSIRSGVVSGTLPQAQPIQQLAAQIKGIYEAIGDKKSGMALNAASTDLSFSYSAGMVFESGIGFFTGLPPFNSLDIAALSPVVFQHVDQNNVRSANTTQLDVGSWDNAGTTEAIPGNGARSQIFTVFISPFSLNVRVIRGQEFYASAGEAFTALQSGTYNPIVPQQIIDAAVLIGWIITEKSAIDLSDGNQIFVTSNRDGTIGGSISTSGAAALLASNNLSDISDLPTAKANLNYLASEIPTNTANFSENLTPSETNLQLALDKLSKTRKSLSVGYNVVFSDTLGTDWLGHQNNGRLTVNSNAGGGTNPVLGDGLTSFGAINAGSESGAITFDFAYSAGSFNFIEICAMIIDRVTLIETFIKKTIDVTAGGRQYEEFDLSSYSALNNSSIYIFYRATTAPAASESFNVSVSLI